MLLLLSLLSACDTQDAADSAPAEWACGDPWSSEDPDLPLPDTWAPSGDEFLVVVLPDTQIYAMSYPETFDSQLRWVARWAEAYNIAFVSHVGDIVQHGNAADEWDVAVAAYGWLEDEDIPHGFAVGGHDFSVGADLANTECGTNFAHMDCDMAHFMERFGPAHYADRAWFAGSSESGHSSYQRVQAGGLELLFLHMPQDPRLAELEWAKAVLDANPDALAHITTHRHLFDYRLTEDLPEPLNLLPAGRFNALTYLLGGQSLIFQDSVNAEELYQELVVAYPNVWGVHCGHVDAEFKQGSTNVAGLPVHEVLVDFQDMSDGGGGWLRLLKFKPAEDQVDVLTFSTLTGEIRANGDGFEHAIGIVEHYKEDAVEALAGMGIETEGLDEYLAAVKTEGSEERADYYETLYEDGDRDSCFTLDVPFAAYLEAAR
ncbi:MAG: hypothetical protein H6741_20480 [Alphaproteobacteria bacterium]|nr:hypothetical protein [Alphaproteobacteria bacterium]MCB9795085.1 hypothetical protein [Alphaproteobacteria bacterium]